jgi:hypothetical protein
MHDHDHGENTSVTTSDGPNDQTLPAALPEEVGLSTTVHRPARHAMACQCGICTGG